MVCFLIHFITYYIIFYHCDIFLGVFSNPQQIASNPQWSLPNTYRHILLLSGGNSTLSMRWVILKT